MVIDVIELRLDRSGTVPHLRAGDHGVDLQLILQKTIHARPVSGLRVDQKLDKIRARGPRGKGVTRKRRDRPRFHGVAGRKQRFSAGPEGGVSDLFVTQGLIRPLPRLQHRLGCAIFLAQPCVPLRPEFGRKGFAQAVDSAVVVFVEQRVLIVDLDHGHARFIAIGALRVGIDVRQQIACVLFLQLNHARLEIIEPFVKIGPPITRAEPVALVPPPAHMQIDVHIDSALLQSIHQVIHPFQHRRIKTALRRGIVRNQPLPFPVCIHMMHADAVDP